MSRQLRQLHRRRDRPSEPRVGGNHSDNGGDAGRARTTPDTNP
jgi:hypothetical protein